MTIIFSENNNNEAGSGYRLRLLIYWIQILEPIVKQHKWWLNPDLILKLKRKSMKESCNEKLQIWNCPYKMGIDFVYELNRCSEMRVSTAES